MKTLDEYLQKQNEVYTEGMDLILLERVKKLEDRVARLEKELFSFNSNTQSKSRASNWTGGGESH